MRHSLGEYFSSYGGGSAGWDGHNKNNEVCRLFVLPAQQGKGYGRALLEYSEKEIFQVSERIRLDASLPAKKIYLRRGYREIESHAILTQSGDYLCYDVMEKVADFIAGT